MKKYILILLFYGIVFTSVAQEPSYKIIGQEELAGLDIYSILQDKKGCIWLATNRGLVKYDGYDFNFISTGITGNRSLFGLTESPNGEIYCFTLGGEIYSVNDNKPALYFKIPDSLLNKEQTMHVDENGELIIVGYHFFRITPSRKIIMIKDKEENLVHASSGFKSKSGELYFGVNRSGFIGKYVQGKVVEQKFVTDCPDGLYPVYSMNGYYVQIPNTFSIYKNTNDRYVQIPLQISKQVNQKLVDRVWVMKDSSIWVVSRTGGMYVFSNDGTPKYNRNCIFSSYYISGFLEDHEGNYWFSTLGKGILYVANPSFISYKTHPLLKDEVITVVTAMPDGGGFIATESGKVYKIDHDGNIQLFLNREKRKITFMKYDSKKKVLKLETHETLDDIHVDSKRLVSSVLSYSIKDIAPYHQGSWVHASSKGVSVFENNHIKWLVNGRYNKVYYDTSRSELWIIGVGGTHIINSFNEINPVNTNGIFITDIEGTGNNIWLATNEWGILQVSNGKVIKHFTISDGLTGLRIRKLLLNGDRLFISHERGLQVFDIFREKFINVDVTDGLSSNFIIDFDVHDEHVLLATNNGLTEFDLPAVHDNHSKPIIEMIFVKVDDSVYTNSQIRNFRFDQNHFEFKFRALAYQHHGALVYMYRLKGENDEWQTTSFNENYVKYLSLAPGEYNFQVKSINENGVESEQIEYSFLIKPAFWQRWWFLLFCALLGISLVYVLFRIQIKQIELKNRRKNELTSSRLTALKSQMNPHFIFNSLNSIQDLILQQETEKSYDYIVKFSDLVRQTLNYSDQDFIDFEDELKLLNVYLELEQLRFSNGFKYTIEKKNIEEIEVPPMLVQPFVENAIKHGLLHKKGEKQLSLVFEQSNVLTCTITDNGVGRKKAKEIKERQNKAYASFSVQAIKSRFEIMQELYKSELGVSYVDLYEDEKPVGTKVVIRLPFKSKY